MTTAGFSKQPVPVLSERRQGLGTWRVLIVVAFVVVTASVLSLMALRTNYITGRWGLTVSGVAAPGRIEFAGREYDRNQGTVTLPGDVVKRGRTPGGADIYADPADNSPLIVFVVDGEDVAQYGLVGGV